MSHRKGVIEEALESLENLQSVPTIRDVVKPATVEHITSAKGDIATSLAAVSGARAKARPKRRKIEAPKRRPVKKKRKETPTRGKRPVNTSRRFRASEMNSIVDHVSQRIERLERFGTDQQSAKRLLEAAKAAHKKKRGTKALETLAKVRKEVSVQEIQIIRDILSDAQGKFVSAKKAGIDIGPSVRLLMLSRKYLKKCDLERAAEFARLANRKVEESLMGARKAEALASTSSRAVAFAESIGAVIPEANALMAEIRMRLEKDEFEQSADCSKRLLTIARESSQQRARECVDMAERSLGLAIESNADVGAAKESLEKAKQHLENMELALSIRSANSSILDSNQATLAALKNRTGRIGDFARGVSGEIESLSQVQEAIIHSRERNLEMIRKYAYLTEEIVSQSYDTAASYSRVSQDIVKQAYDSSVEIDPSAVDPEGLSYSGGMAATIGQALSASNEDRRLRIIDMFLTGKISQNQLDRLLVLLDSNTPKVELAEMVASTEIQRT